MTMLRVGESERPRRYARAVHELVDLCRQPASDIVPASKLVTCWCLGGKSSPVIVKLQKQIDLAVNFGGQSMEGQSSHGEY